MPAQDPLRAAKLAALATLGLEQHATFPQTAAFDALQRIHVLGSQPQNCRVAGYPAFSARELNVPADSLSARQLLHMGLVLAVRAEEVELFAAGLEHTGGASAATRAAAALVIGLQLAALSADACC